MQGKSVIISVENNVECNLIENKIIIKCPENRLNNVNVYQIGILDDNNTFKNEYFLIYYGQYYNHFNHIMRNLNKYLSSVQFYNRCPIVNAKGQRIGQIRIIKMRDKSGDWKYVIIVFIYLEKININK